MSNYRSGICPRCHRRLGVDGAGRVLSHRDPKNYDTGRPRTCWGSGRAATEVKEEPGTVPAYTMVWGH